MTVAQVSAQELFQAAYENRYTWERTFPGYTADVLLKLDGQDFKGTVRVNPDLTAEVFDIEDEQAKKLVHGQLWEIAIHRVRRSFEETHSKNTFAYGETDESGAVAILMGGKSEGDRYKVHNGEVSLVHRHMHGVVITINTFSTHDTGEGYLPYRYDSVYQDPKTGEQKGGKSLFEDEYEQVGGFFILNRRFMETDVHGKTSTQEFLFSNIQLFLPNAA
ncbi:DUF3386 domain-containing protein [Phormidium sp. CLA17]|uniref:DUF3386 domain-containing protein n=1 Tax=Leptolyngbya sp. Cla-17 TaxID=2803751 RepID=UPI001490E0EF|nr:DUF3386 domain-containing protein [Leptolyngbya sp. Cla-17]MBM0741437.1 DUF3386 domain-containing protein [Leptolyngbya sp. Cla-17]